MINENIVDGLKKRYEKLNPLVFHRSLEKAETAIELFDILENIPNVPFVWEDDSKKWAKTSDFFCIGKVKSILKSEE
jgi:hypothetical protein